MSDHTYEFDVAMSCGGCSGAINRVLTKLEGVKSHDVSLEKQTATVVAEPTLSYETVLATISKTGKKIKAGRANGEERSIEVVAAA
ncbi:copper chaperone [Ceratocystis lukuohia]|uniref:Metal homeostasis factor ATX1 n=3 Tax=Ceratocystis TaxID=5157 RepID=A0A0F8B480_CERFI|nr:Metal homeostasis factor ATX1 [Ceratocystis platani]PHH55711.1 Metal homeostasis factor ATX1 [Ceratocystis fimbriata CBS 114723]